MFEVTQFFRFLACYTLCVLYSLWIVFEILYDSIFKSEKIWVVKERPIKPHVLTSNEYGEHKFMKVNGIKIHYVENGDPSKPLILFVHGFPEFWFSWRHQLKEFSKDYHVIAINQRGYEESDKPAKVSDYDIDFMVEDIRQFVKQLKREKFTLICHDWGAVIGFRYVLKYSETLEKYVMIGGMPNEVWLDLVNTPKQFMMSWYVFFFQMPFLPEFSSRLSDLKIFERMNIKSEEDLEAYKYVYSKVTGKQGAFTGPINYYRAAAKFLVLDTPIKRPSMFPPGLLLLGEGDKYISRACGKLTKKLYDNLQFKLIRGANHFAQQHAPDETNRMIREFIGSK